MTHVSVSSCKTFLKRKKNNAQGRVSGQKLLFITGKNQKYGGWGRVVLVGGIVQKWLETLAEVRLPVCGDELVAAYYHRTAWRYDLSLSINPRRCPWFKFTTRNKNVYCSKATFHWTVFFWFPPLLSEGILGVECSSVQPRSENCAIMTMVIRLEYVRRCRLSWGTFSAAEKSAPKLFSFRRECFTISSH